MIRRFLISLLPKTTQKEIELKKLQKMFLNEMDESTWEKAGRPMPPPSHLKKREFRKLKEKYDLNIFVETGTFLGKTTLEMSKLFNRVFTIEFDQYLFERASNKFKNDVNVKLFQGDSGIVLNLVTNEIDKNEKVLFYLDGHYSGTNTGHSDKKTPILEELRVIFNHSVLNVISIDDARLFDGNTDEYPSLDVLLDYVKSLAPDYDSEVIYDMILLTPKNIN